MSTSPLLLTAQIFSAWPPGGAILRIAVRSGMRGIDMTAFSQNPDEQEMLLPRGVGLRIVAVAGAMIEAEAI